MKYFLISFIILLANFVFSNYKNQGRYVIMVQPIIVQSDNGENPASMSLPEDLVDKAYSPADIDFVFFEPIYYNSTKARDGEINLDQIVKEAKNQHLIRGNGDIVNMFFVNKVDGKTGPLGRGMFGGNITFIALGNSKTIDQRFMEAFVIAHEVGHNLGLNHAVDDVNVPNSIPNIQGEGSYEDRIDPINSLNDYQIEEIHKSSLVTRKIDFLSKERGQVGILDESFEPYFSILQDREVHAFTKEWSNAKTIEETREFAKNKFQTAVIEFSEKEEECIKFVISKIDSILSGQNIELFEDHPWRFIKVEDWLCGSFAHTRGTYTILSQRYLDKYTSKFSTEMTEQEQKDLIVQLGGLLIHEQLHSIQRTHPKLFQTLYTDFWSFDKVSISPNLPELITNQLLNPDAPNADWIYKNGKKMYWIRVLLDENSENPIMGKDFVSVVYEIEIFDGKYYLRMNKKGKPISFKIKKLKKYIKSFPISNGIDHPNEISAYMYSEYFKALVMGDTPFDSAKKSSRKNTELFVNWMHSKLPSIGDQL